MKFHVTQNHIDRGVAGNSCLCPVALCMAQALPTGTQIGVSSGSAWVRQTLHRDPKWSSHTLPGEASDFIATFDADGEVYPFSFEIPTLNPL